MIRKLLTVHPRFWLFVLTMMTVLSICAFVSGQSRLARQAEQLEALQAERMAIIEANAALQHEIDFTYTDEYIEREARSKLRLIMPDEILFESID